MNRQPTGAMVIDVVDERVGLAAASPDSLDTDHAYCDWRGSAPWPLDLHRMQAGGEGTTMAGTSY